MVQTGGSFGLPSSFGWRLQTQAVDHPRGGLEDAEQRQHGLAQRWSSGGNTKRREESVTVLFCKDRDATVSTMVEKRCFSKSRVATSAPTKSPAVDSEFVPEECKLLQAGPRSRHLGAVRPQQ